MHLTQRCSFPAGRLILGLLLTALAAPAVERPTGTFSSAGAGNNPSDAKGIYGDTQLRGVLIRVSWETIEPSPGNFNFSSLTNQINNVKSRGLSWSMGVLGGGIGSPAWLTAPAGAGGLGAPYVNYSFRGAPGYKLPLYWNPTVQDRLQKLAAALAAQYNNDPALKLVYITQMTSNGIEGHLQGVNMGDLVAAGYTDANWIAASKQAARSFANAFTNKALAFEVHYVNNGATVPATIINDLWDDPSLDHRVGAAMWWISGRTNYQPELIEALKSYPGDLYGQVIANSGTTSEFLNGDYATVFAQARQLFMRYIEPWDYEFADTANSAHRAWDATFAEFNAWADATFAGDGTPPAANAPAITVQPVSLTVAVGGAATFSVIATGTAPFSYQWKAGGTDLAGATSATLTLGNVQAANAGTYTVTVANSAGSTTSAAATLTVNAAPIPAPPPSSGGGGGGGAPSWWFLAALALLALGRGRQSVYWSRSDLAAVCGRTTARAPWLHEISGLCPDSRRR